MRPPFKSQKQSRKKTLLGRHKNSIDYMDHAVWMNDVQL
jgi:hypothetical protein